MKTVVISKSSYNSLRVTIDGVSQNLVIVSASVYYDTRDSFITLAVKSVGVAFSIDLSLADDITISGEQFSGTLEQLVSAINVMLDSVPSSGTGIESVSGALVDNTDPLNPVIQSGATGTFQAAGNKTITITDGLVEDIEA